MVSRKECASTQFFHPTSRVVHSDNNGNADSGANTWGLLIPPSSRHAGGVNAGRADGSVSFITNSIDAGNLSMTETLSGQSPYGVWGALGSKSGGEVVTEQ